MVDDHALLTQWRGGDRASGDALFQRHFRSVRRFFKSKVGPSEAEDLIQRTFLGCVKNIADYRGDASFRTYLFAVARNVLYMHFRSSRARPDADLDLSLHSVIDLRTGVSTELGRKDERALVRVALRHLSVDDQTLLELSYWEGLDSAALAAVFEVSPVTIRTRRHRARQRLKKVVDELSEPGSALDLDSVTEAAGDL